MERTFAVQWYDRFSCRTFTELPQPRPSHRWGTTVAVPWLCHAWASSAGFRLKFTKRFTTDTYVVYNKLYNTVKPIFVNRYIFSSAVRLDNDNTFGFRSRCRCDIIGFDNGQPARVAFVVIALANGDINRFMSFFTFRGRPLSRALVFIVRAISGTCLWSSNPADFSISRGRTSIK